VQAAPAQWVLSMAAFVLGLGVNTLLAMALLTAPPRLHLPPRRVIGPTLVITIGLEILKTLGQVRRELEVCCPLDGGRRSRPGASPFSPSRGELRSAPAMGFAQNAHIRLRAGGVD
jgi:hypothetical protein